MAKTKLSRYQVKLLLDLGFIVATGRTSARRLSLPGAPTPKEEP